MAFSLVQDSIDVAESKQVSQKAAYSHTKDSPATTSMASPTEGRAKVLTVSGAV